MSAPPYMRLYWGDYHRDTHHLNRGEHGAYLLLISALWGAGGKLPDDDLILARLALCTPEEWAELRPVIIPFFRIVRGKLTHKRVSAELAKYDDTLRKRKEAGKKGGSARHGKDTENPEANAKQKPPKPEPEPEPKSQIVLFPEPSEKKPTQQSDKVAQRGSRLKSDWVPGADNLAYAITLGFSTEDVDRMAEDFRDYWAAQPGQRGVKLDWTATWRRWVRTQAERRPRRQAPRQVDWC